MEVEVLDYQVLEASRRGGGLSTDALEFFNIVLVLEKDFSIERNKNNNNSYIAK